jgi:hypothetical protein
VVLVFASGKDRANPVGTLHTDFKLSLAGGYLALSDASGAIVHGYDYPKQEGNVSFGLLAAGTPADGVYWRRDADALAAARPGAVTDAPAGTL